MLSLASRTMLVLAFASSLALAQSPRELVRLNPNGGNPSGTNANNGRSITHLGSTYLCCYAEQNNTSEDTEDIYAVVSFDGGFTWSTPGRVDVGDPMNTTDSNDPVAMITQDPLNPGSLIFACIWEESRLEATPTGNGAGDDVFAAWSSDGMNWNLATTTVAPNLGVLNLGAGTWGSAVQRETDERNACASNGIVHAIWEEDGVNSGCSAGNEAVYYSRSIDGGRSYDAPRILNTVYTATPPCDINDIDNPYVAADGQLVVVAWCDNILSLQNASSANDDVWVAISFDGGLNFGAPTAIEAAGLEDLGDVDDTYVIVEGLSVAVIYEDDEFSGFDVATIMLSSDGGITWGNGEQHVSPATVNTSGAGVAFIDCAISGQNVYYCFCSDWNAQAAFGAAPSNGGGSGTRELYLSVSHDFGVNWNYDISLDPNRPDNECAVGAIDNMVMVAAQRNPYGANDSAYWLSRDGGNTFSFHEIVSSQGFDIDQTSKRRGPHFAFDGVTQTGMSCVAFNRTGQNEPYVCGLRTPGLALGSPAPGRLSFDVSGVYDPGTATAFAIMLSLTGTSPFTMVGDQVLNFVIDTTTVSFIGTFTGAINANGAGSTLPFPDLGGPFGIYAVGLTINLLNVDIQLTDPIVL